jgi:UDP-N-acetylmuramate-alanine ligase
MNDTSSYISSREEVESNLINDLKDNDLIVFQGAGDVTGLCDDFVTQLKNKLN